jgi:hypothetical protein
MRSALLRHPLLAILLSALICAVLSPCARGSDVLKCDQLKVDLGPISDERPQLQPFHVTNISGRKIRIAMGFCHFCAQPILDKTVLQPGEVATVVIELDPTGRRGPYSASATVAEEGKPDTRLELELRADICPRIWIEPTNMFPRIVRGKGAEGSFTVTGRASNFKVLKVESTVPMDGIDIGPTTEVEEFGSTARKQEITVHFPKDAPIGPFSAALRVITTDETARSKEVGVTAQVVGCIGHAPDTIRLQVKPGEAFRTTFDIVADEGPIILHSLDVTDRDECKSVAVDFTPTPDSARIRVVVSGTAPPRERQLIAINVRIVASTLTMAGEESHDVPVMLVSMQPRR